MSTKTCIPYLFAIFAFCLMICCILSSVYDLSYSVFCQWFVVFCLLSLICCILPSVYDFFVFCLLSMICCNLSSFYDLLYSVFCLLSMIYCILSSVSDLLYSVFLYIYAFYSQFCPCYLQYKLCIVISRCHLVVQSYW